ncbi:unnamed protein product [Zymoseptoria tritici ST99CH_3D7]|uniref:Uncharacterized protein n=1 Tax=Zymoseptoria tritici (strain ST99CH_3D7) TaxID=1276538 RepID=A0A1X7RKX8_ZYMT9|nr:unnamed protein product [Zymoseptoria tritici ST99CH_3D7]
MPAVSPVSALNFLTARANDAASNASSTSAQGIQVVCAWPVSSQYGPSSRVLYYILICTCVFARKADWLRNACVGLALLLPVTAALHGIVLSAVHTDGAVDMDVYGAFQLCAIGVLAAPVAVRHSTTYFNDPGRNLIFVWTVVLLSGLISLAVEFYRINTTLCQNDNFGNPITSVRSFPYGNANCTFPRCSTEEGPFSPVRGGAANNIYIIPAPTRLTFRTATLLAAACCIPAILLLVSMWFKILESIWKSSHANGSKSRRGSMMPVEEREPSISHPIRIITNDESEKPNVDYHTSHREQAASFSSNDGVLHRHQTGPPSTDSPPSSDPPPEPKRSPIPHLIRSYGEPTFFTLTILTILLLGELNLFSPQVRYQQEPLGNIGQWSPLAGTILGIIGSLYLLLTQAITEEKHAPGGEGLGRRSARGAMEVGEWFGNVARKVFDDSEFRRGKAMGYPEVPGERERNPGLGDTISIYSPSIRRGSGGSDDSGRSRAGAPMTRSRSNTLEVVRTETMDTTRRKTGKRRDTLEVPSSPGQARVTAVGGTLSRSVSMEEPRTTEVADMPIIVVSPSEAQVPERRAQSRRHTVESAIDVQRPVMKREDEQ